MAKRYVLTRDKNAKIEKYLAIRREGRALVRKEKNELDALKKSIS